MSQKFGELPTGEHAAQLQLQLDLLEGFTPTPMVTGSIKGAMRRLNDSDPTKEAPSRDLWQLDPAKLRVIPGLNPRVNTPAYQAHVRETIDSMKRHGFYQDKPLAGIVVDEDGVDVVYIWEGETRLGCSLQAIAEMKEEAKTKGPDVIKFLKVPVSVSMEPFLSQDGKKGQNKPIDMYDILVAKVKGNRAHQFTIYEMAVLVLRAEEQEKKPRSKIAVDMGISVQHVGNLIKLMKAPDRLRYLVATETVSASFAIETLVKFADDGEGALRHIEAAMQNAIRAGSDSVSAKHAPQARFTSAVKRAAPTMYTTLSEVKADPNFGMLSEATRQKLEKFLNETDALRDPEPEGAGEQAAPVASAGTTAQLA